MANLNFKVYEGTSTLSEIGTVKQLAGDGAKLSFRKSNWEKTDKCVAAFVSRPDGTSVLIPCSKSISSQLRAGTMLPSELVNHPIYETEELNDDGLPTHIIGIKGSDEPVREFAIDGMAVVNIKAPKFVEYLPESFMAF